MSSFSENQTFFKNAFSFTYFRDIQNELLIAITCAFCFWPICSGIS